MMGWDEDDYKQLKRNLAATDKPKPRHRKGGERVASVPKDAPPIERNANGTEYAGTANKCPECGASYDATETCSGDRNRRQYTRHDRATGVDYDWFECFCKPPVTWLRYK